MRKHFIFIGALLFILSSAHGSFAQQDFSKVEITATKVAGNIYMLQGSGGNIGVSVGTDGILIVDDQFAPLADKIKKALKDLGEGKHCASTPYRVNSHRLIRVTNDITKQPTLLLSLICS